MRTKGAAAVLVLFLALIFSLWLIDFYRSECVDLQARLQHLQDFCTPLTET